MENVPDLKNGTFSDLHFFFSLCSSQNSFSFLLETSHKTTFWITLGCLTVCWNKVDGILHSSSAISSENKANLGIS